MKPVTVSDSQTATLGTIATLNEDWMLLVECVLMTDRKWHDMLAKYKEKNIVIPGHEIVSERLAKLMEAVAGESTPNPP